MVSAYLERVQLYFVANDVAVEKKAAVLLSVIGSKTNTLLQSATPRGAEGKVIWSISCDAKRTPGAQAANYC